MRSTARFTIAGVRLDATRQVDVVGTTTAWCHALGARPRTICFVNAFSVVSAAREPAFAKAINESDLSVPDGVPVAWLGKFLTQRMVERLSGPDLMHHMLTSSEYDHLTHFILGGSQDSLDRLEFRYNRAGLAKPRRIIGTYSPPFRDLTQDEEFAFVSRLATLKPHILWVCLGTGRQEKWMARMQDRLSVPVMAGVGAAVDFLSGNKPRAPRWMQRLGLEWLFRLSTEPHRLWRRYLLGNVVFLRLAAAEIWRHRTARAENP